MSKVRNSDIRSELRPSAQLLKLTYTAASESAFEKFDRQCIKKYRGRWKSRNTVAEEKAIVRDDGSILRILIVRCEDSEEENVTGLLWLHDGGYAFGVPEQESLLVDMFCGDGTCVAVLPDYLKSIEAPYPSALEDCYRVLLWMKNNAEELGINRDQIFVGGSGAGGGLTAALCLRARDMKDVRIAFQMPISPMLDDRMESESAKENNAPVWDSRKNRAAWDLYLRDMKEEIPVYAAPGRETDLGGMPPACSIVGDLEPVKDETVLYFTRMKKEDVPVSLRVYHGCFHSFEITAVNSSVALNAQRYLLDSFRYAQKKYFAHNEEDEVEIEDEPVSEEETEIEDRPVSEEETEIEDGPVKKAEAETEAENEKDAGPAAGEGLRAEAGALSESIRETEDDADPDSKEQKEQ